MPELKPKAPRQQHHRLSVWNGSIPNCEGVEATGGGGLYTQAAATRFDGLIAHWSASKH
ncbi:hypothetical protein HanHA300_Chr02g0053981 [Helianthus annuus]|nr:hypothetical protein HanHA300_Chr02g0053981 [Helianthus annuus]KAJ0618777.1 hypothetical protein HanHA89_Chr02g0057431 [Helianthus annuus]KAJ0777236.1 hypothetical protein HanLR1_Chr02g0055081 [Helianthus annuus]